MPRRSARESPLEAGKRYLLGVAIVLGKVIGDARYRGVHLRAAQGFCIDYLAGRGMPCGVLAVEWSGPGVTGWTWR